MEGGNWLMASQVSSPGSMNAMTSPSATRSSDGLRSFGHDGHPTRIGIACPNRYSARSRAFRNGDESFRSRERPSQADIDFRSTSVSWMASQSKWFSLHRSPQHRQGISMTLGSEWFSGSPENEIRSLGGLACSLNDPSTVFLHIEDFHP